MTITYVGSRKSKDMLARCTYADSKQFSRLAEFSYRENEEKRFCKIADYLRKCGWDIDTGVFTWAAIEVGDRSEYNAVARDFREAKRKIK